jgi:hypothetical protein
MKGIHKFWPGVYFLSADVRDNGQVLTLAGDKMILQKTANGIFWTWLTANRLTFTV